MQNEWDLGQDLLTTGYLPTKVLMTGFLRSSCRLMGVFGGHDDKI